MTSVRSGSPPSEYAEYPEIKEQIGENPARYLDYDFSRLNGDGYKYETWKARIRGLESIEVVNAWVQVEADLDRGPRRRVIAALNQRKAELENHEQ